jgi:hypothetical protein
MIENAKSNFADLAVGVVLILVITSCSQSSSSRTQNGSNASGNSSILTKQNAKENQDFTVVSNLSAQGESVGTATGYYSGTKSRVSGRTQNDSNDRIQDFSLERVITIDHKRKEFYENSMLEIRGAMEKKMAEQLRKLDKVIRENPELEQVIRSDASEVTVSQRRNAKTIAGYSCNQYTFSMGNMVRIDVWSTVELPRPPRYYAQTIIPPDPILGKRLLKMYEEMGKQVEGFPLAEKTTINILTNNLESLLEAQEVKQGKIAESVFEAPTGYQRKKGLPRDLFGVVVSKSQ